MASPFVAPFQKTNRSAYVNFLLSKYEMYRGETSVKSYPYYLLVEPSDVCQLRCPTCVTGIENQSKRGDTLEKIIFRQKRAVLTPELFDALMDELGEYLYMLVFYNFGEPLLNKKLPSFVRKARTLNIETDINTNLSLPLADEFIEDLLTAGLDYLHASIDGFSQEAYQIHRVGGDIQLVKKNLERFVQARERLGLRMSITYNFLVFSFNEHEISQAEEYCSDLGINLNVKNAFIHNPDWLPSYRKDETPRVVPREAELPREFSYRQGETTFSWSALPEVDNPLSRCSWHYGFSAVSAGGAVTPCCFVPHEDYDFGRVVPGNQNFRTVWNSDILKKSRADFGGRSSHGLEEVKTVCTRCPAPKLINHLYSMHDYKVIGQYYKIFGTRDPVLSQAFELLANTEYGISMEDLFTGDVFTLPQQLFGHDSPEGAVPFLNYCESYLMPEFSSQAVSGAAT